MCEYENDSNGSTLLFFLEQEEYGTALFTLDTDLCGCVGTELYAGFELFSRLSLNDA